ncbi:MAG TPA: hypothetical protein VKJ45_28705 [Blastocatellia bacterium]|nr:hypothetical protein [Blastocatellia bacterium]
METILLVFGCVSFGSGVLLAVLGSSIPHRLIDEINERSPADQQVDTFRLTETILRRHQQLCPDSSNRRLMNAAMISGILMWAAGIGLLLDYSSLHDLNRNQVLGPRQRSIAGTLSAGPISRNTYNYTFSVGANSYSGWGSMYGPEPKIGQQVVIYYDPDDPTVNALGPFEFSARERAWKVGIGLSLVLFVITGSVKSISVCWKYWDRSGFTTPGAQ